MSAQLVVDGNLLREAKQIGQHETESAAVIAALQEYIQRHKQLKVLELFGQIDYDPDFDYKEQRKKA